MKPNLFLAGFQKCGTTSLAAVLGALSEVSVSIPKEPHYLVIEELSMARIYGRVAAPDLIADRSTYYSLFDGVSARYRCDASAMYAAYPQEFLRAIMAEKLDVDSKCVLIIRDPVDRLLSAFRYARRSNPLETRSSILEPNGKIEAAVRSGYRALDYLGMSRYSSAIAEIGQVLELEVVLYERLFGTSSSEAQLEFDRLMDFLEIPRRSFESQQRNVGSGRLPAQLDSLVKSRIGFDVRRRVAARCPTLYRAARDSVFSTIGRDDLPDDRAAVDEYFCDLLVGEVDAVNALVPFDVRQYWTSFQ